MSEETLIAFLQKVQGDISLQEKLKATNDFNTVEAIAKEAGFSVSADELFKLRSEISDRELEAAAGGGALCPSPEDSKNLGQLTLLTIIGITYPGIFGCG